MQIVKGTTPTSKDWGPQVSQDATAKAVLAALPQPQFFVCFFTRSDEPKNKINILIHGKVSMAQLHYVHEMLDQLIEEQEKKFADA